MVPELDPWPVDWSACTLVDGASPAATGTAVACASYVLHALSGRQFGLTSVTLRPCRRDCFPDGILPDGYGLWLGGYPTAALVGGVWMNLTCYSCSGSCSCSRLEELWLAGPVRDVVQVKVNGTPLATGGAYRLDASQFLVRVDGGSWPLCQDLSLDDSQPGTWSVTARFGRDVPTLGQVAVGELACEFLRGFRGEDCALPRSVVNLARQGVTMAFPDPATLLENHRLGLRISDLFIDSVNPHHLAQRSRVLSPDTLARRPRRVG